MEEAAEEAVEEAVEEAGCRLSTVYRLDYDVFSRMYSSHTTVLYNYSLYSRVFWSVIDLKIETVRGPHSHLTLYISSISVLYRFFTGSCMVFVWFYSGGRSLTHKS